MTERVLLNRYELGAELGRGGMAIVYRGRDRLLGRDVAVKLLSDHANRERFLTEARRTALLKHPNVGEVLDAGEEGDDAFLVMDLLEGEPLASTLKRTSRLAPSVAVGIATQICAGLTAAHERGLVHRDIKPANVFLCPAADAAIPRVKILDFGVAKRVDGSTIETDPGLMVGTFAFMAPEQIRGDALDGRADLYALGVTLFRMLAGRLPFEHDTAASLVFAHLSTPAPRLPDADSDAVIGRLDPVVRRLLAKSPDDRPASATVAAEEIARTLEEPPPTRELELTAADLTAPVSFEIDRGPEVAAIAPRPVVPAAIARWPSVPPAAPLPTPATSRGRMLALLGTLPKSVSKRVAAYSALALVLSLIFFSPPAALVVALSLLTIAGLLSFFAGGDN